MNKQNINKIKNCENEIEKKRLAIRKIKKDKIRLINEVDTLGDVYEYFAVPSCTISIMLVSLFSGFGVFILPIIATLATIIVVVAKLITNNKIESLEKKIDELKLSRQEDYKNREKIYASIFDVLQKKNLDKFDYYHQIVEVSNCCDLLTESTFPYKKKMKEMIETRSFLRKIFDYLLAPLGSIFLPLVCALFSIGIAVNVVLVFILSSILFSLVMIDEKLTKKIQQISIIIDEIKKDRTINYIKRDLMLRDCLEFLENTINFDFEKEVVFN